MRLHHIAFLLAFLSVVLLSCTPPSKNRVVILKYATHPALDELEASYFERLSNLLKDDEKLKAYSIEKYDANGSPQTAKSIAETFAQPNENVRLILAVATPAAIAVSNTKSQVPFVYGAVADPQGAGIIPSSRATGIQNAGEGIIVEALSFIRKAFPNARKLGTIYNPSEQNSVFVQRLIQTNAARMGFELQQVTVNSGSQLAGVAESLCNQVDVLYSANDNTVNAGVSAIVSVAKKKGKPFIIGDLSTLKAGPLFAVGLEYKSMGIELAEISYQLLKGKTVGDFPPQPAPKPEVWMNSRTAAELKYTFADASVSDLVKKRIE